MRTHALRLRLVYFMRRLLFVALTAGLLSPTAAIADTYDALCNDNNCQIIINESGLAGPQGLIAKEKITQWYSGGDEYNLASGATEGAAGGTVGLAIGNCSLHDWNILSSGIGCWCVWRRENRCKIR